MEFRYQHNDAHHAVRIIQKDGVYEVLIGERRYTVSAREVDAHTLDLLIDGRYLRAKHAGEATQRWVAAGKGAPVNAARLLHRRRPRARAEGGGSLAATMPGQVTAVLVSPGDVVEAGQPLVIMEAMKMELRMAAPADGTVGVIHVAPGEQVERGQTLVEMSQG